MTHRLSLLLAAAALTADAAAAAAAAAAPAACPITPTSVVAAYVDVDGGVGTHSAAWTKAFFSWWAAASPPGALEVAYIEAAGDLAGCAPLASYEGLLLWVQPGGEADNQSVALGPSGRDNILDFAASPHGHVYATCAGWYFSAGQYWWYNDYFPRAWMPHWWPTVEGPIYAIASYPDYAPTKLSNGLTAIYYGGPCMGCNTTTSILPNGQVAFFGHQPISPHTSDALPQPPPPHTQCARARLFRPPGRAGGRAGRRALHWRVH